MLAFFPCLGWRDKGAWHKQAVPESDLHPIIVFHMVFAIMSLPL